MKKFKKDLPCLSKGIKNRIGSKNPKMMKIRISQSKYSLSLDKSIVASFKSLPLKKAKNSLCQKCLTKKNWFSKAKLIWSRIREQRENGINSPNGKRQKRIWSEFIKNTCNKTKTNLINSVASRKEKSRKTKKPWKIKCRQNHSITKLIEMPNTKS